jgi:hypothetical protein
MTNSKRSTERSATGKPLHALLDHHEPKGLLQERVDVTEFAGGIPQVPTQVPSLRLGQRWVNSLWLVAIGIIGLILVIALAQQLRQYGWMQSFIERIPAPQTVMRIR